MIAAYIQPGAAISRALDRGCLGADGAGKLSYRTRAQAHAVALAMIVLDREDVAEYRCGSCGLWHCGHVAPLPVGGRHRGAQA